MPIRKIHDTTWEWLKKPCSDADHNVPDMMLLSPGKYEHVCPSCGKKTIFSIDDPKLEADGKGWAVRQGNLTVLRVQSVEEAARHDPQ